MQQSHILVGLVPENEVIPEALLSTRRFLGVGSDEYISRAKGLDNLYSALLLCAHKVLYMCDMPLPKHHLYTRDIAYARLLNARAPHIHANHKS
jgi:hypothetical protein